MEIKKVKSPSAKSILESLQRGEVRLAALEDKYEVTTPAPKWHAGDQPTARETIARIYDVAGNDETRFSELMGKYRKAQETKGSIYYNPYTKATNSKAIEGLAGLGLDMSGGVTQDFLDQYASLRNYDRTSTGYSPLAPSSKSTPEQDAAYWYAQLQEAEPTTKAAENEWARMQKELTYWANKGLSDEEAIAKLDWSNYKTLAKMDEKKATGDALLLNRAVGYSKDAMYGALWAARNLGGTGNATADMVNSARGVGNVYKRDANAEDRRNPASKNYNPYTSATIDEALIGLGVSKIDDAWLEANRGMLATDQADLWRDLAEINENTKQAKKELAELKEDVDLWLRLDLSPERIAKRFEESDEYDTLKKMDEARALGQAYALSDAVDYRWEDMYAYAQAEHAKRGLPIEEQSQLKKDEYVAEHGNLLGGDSRQGSTAAMQSTSPEEIERLNEFWLSETPDVKYANPLDALDAKVEEEQDEEEQPDASAKYKPAGAKVLASIGGSDVIYGGKPPEETEQVLDPMGVFNRPGVQTADLQVDSKIASYQDVEQQLAAIESDPAYADARALTDEAIKEAEADRVALQKELTDGKIDQIMFDKLNKRIDERIAFWQDSVKEAARGELQPLEKEKERLEGELLEVIRSKDATREEKMAAAETIGAWDYCANMQYKAIANKLAASPEHAKFVKSTGGAQAAAKVLCAYVVAGEDLRNFNNLDDATRADLMKYQDYCEQALGMYAGDDLYNFIDVALGGSLKTTKYNEGVGIFDAILHGVGMGAAQFDDLVLDVVGAAITTYGYMVEGSEWFTELLGLGRGNTSEKIKQAGKAVSSYYDEQYQKIDQYLLENATTLEYFMARTAGEATKMAGEGYTGKAAATLVQGAAKTLRTCDEALKLERTVKFVSQLPFVSESGAGAMMDTYEVTDNLARSVLAGMASAMTTMATADLGVLGKMDDIGAPFVASVVDKVAAVPGSGAVSAIKRWGVAGMQFFANLAKTGTEEGLQEVIEYLLSEPVVYAMQEGKTFLSKGLEAIGAEAAGNFIWGALSSFGSTMQTLPSYARSVIVAENMMGNGKLTPADVVELVEAYLADQNDPAVVAEMEKNAEQDALETQTGLVIAQDTGLQSAIEASEAAKEAAVQAEAQLEAANEALAGAEAAVLENPTEERVKAFEEAQTAQTQAVDKANQTAETAKAEAEKAAAGLKKARTTAKSMLDLINQSLAEKRATAKEERAERENQEQMGGPLGVVGHMENTKKESPSTPDAAEATNGITPEASRELTLEQSVEQNETAVKSVATGSASVAPPASGGVTTPGAGNPTGPQRQFGSVKAQQSGALHQEVKDWLLKNSTYASDTNKAQIERVIRKIEEEGFDKVAKDWLSADLRTINTPEGQATGVTLMGIAAYNGDTELEVEVADKYNKLGTLAAQSLQARKIFDMLTPLGARQYVLTQVNHINADLAAKHRGVEVKVSKGMLDTISEAETLEKRQEAVDKALKKIAEQIPPTWADRLIAWRYLAMLANPRTHVRNLLGNAVFAPVVGAKNQLAAGLEVIAQKAGLIDERTKTFGKIDEAYLEFAEADALDMKQWLTEGDKYNDKNKIEQYKRSFGKSGLGNFLQKLVDKNSEALKQEDWIFLSRHYRNALAGYLQANNLALDNLPSDQLDKAREYAYNEAKKATYQDASKFVTALNKFAKTNRATELFVEGVLPFKKTPVNVLKRGIEYSPAGLVTTIYKWGKQCAKGYGDMTGTQFIDGLAAGLTGTAAMSLGMLLSGMGLIKGSLGDDKEDKFWKLLGRQEYSVEIGGVSYTVDWMTPIAMPVLAGAAMCEYADENGWSIEAIEEGLLAITEPMFNLSVLDGVNNIIESAKYASENGTVSVATASVSGYLQQFIPTLLGQITRVVDPVRRTTTVTDDSRIPKDVRYFIGKTLNKSVFWSDLNEPYVNEWGEQEVSDNFFLRVFENMLSPGYISKVDPDETEQALMQLAEKVGPDVYPTQASKSFTVSGEKITLTAKEYTAFKEYVGQTKKRLLDEIMTSDEFMLLSDEYQAKVVEDVYTYAAQTGKYRINDGYKLTGWVSSAYEDGTAVSDIIVNAMTAQRKDSNTEWYLALNKSIERGDLEALPVCKQALLDAGQTSAQIKKKAESSFGKAYKEAWKSDDIETCVRIEEALIALDVGFDDAYFRRNWQR